MHRRSWANVDYARQWSLESTQIVSDSEVCRHFVSARARSVCAGWKIAYEVLPCRIGGLARVVA